MCVIIERMSWRQGEFLWKLGVCVLVVRDPGKLSQAAGPQKCHLGTLRIAARSTWSNGGWRLLTLRSHCRQKWPKSNLFFFFFSYSYLHGCVNRKNMLNLAFSIPSWVTFIRFTEINFISNTWQ